LRYLNSHVHCVKFKLEDHNDVPLLLNKGDWIFSLDFKSGYYHLSISSYFHKFFGFFWKGKYYYFVVLPFGLNIAPHVFTEMIKQVLRFWRCKGIRVIGYFDDLLFFAHSFEAAKALMKMVVEDLKCLGWVIAWEKSMRVPAQKAVSLGLEIDSVRELFVVPKNKVLSLLDAIKTVLSKHFTHSLVVCDLARVTGRLASMSRAVPFVRWHMIAIHQCINAILYDRVERGPDMYMRTLWRWDWHLSLSCDAVSELSWWSHNIRQVNGASI
jgi:hypothetical protein